MRHARLLTAAAATAALALAGCVVGPDYHAPAPPTPPAFAGPQPEMGDAVDLAHWWQSFGDARLTGLVEQALRDNPDIATAASRVREARYQLIVARATDQPTVNAMGNATDIALSKNAGFSSLIQQFSGGGGSTGGASGGATSGSSGSSSAGGITLPGSTIKTFAIGFDASWEIDLFGERARTVEGANARLEAAEWSRRDAAVTLAAEVAQTYFAMRLDQVQALTIAEELGRERRALEIAEHTAKVGLTPQSDTTRQRAQITATEARLPPIVADIRVRLHALGTLVGQPPEALLTELDRPAPGLGPVPAVPAGLPSDLIRRRPDVRAAERQLAAANADIGVAVADLYPRISLTGMEELISSGLSNLISKNSLQATGTGAIQFPLFDSGRRRAEVRVRREEREQAYQNWRSTVLQAYRDVEDALVQIDAERTRREALIHAVNDAEESARASAARYRTGLSAQTDVLTDETNVLSAREQLAQSESSLRQDTAALFKALGGGWQETPVPPLPTR